MQLPWALTRGRTRITQQQQCTSTCMARTVFQGRLLRFVCQLPHTRRHSSDIYGQADKATEIRQTNVPFIGYGSRWTGNRIAKNTGRRAGAIELASRSCDRTVKALRRMFSLITVVTRWYTIIPKKVCVHWGTCAADCAVCSMCGTRRKGIHVCLSSSFCFYYPYNLQITYVSIINVKTTTDLTRGSVKLALLKQRRSASVMRNSSWSFCLLLTCAQ